MADPSHPEASLLDDLETEHLNGALPAGHAQAHAARLAYYQLLRDASPTPITCRPQQGVHVYPDVGPCLCTTPNSQPPQEAS